MATLLTDIARLTDIEEAVLLWGFTHGLVAKKKYTKLYTLAANIHPDDITASTARRASEYFATPKVQKYLRQLESNREYDFEAAFNKGKAEGLAEARKEASNEEGKAGTERGKNGGSVDYTRPEAQRELLNSLINESNDPKDKLDAVKVIISSQKDDKQAAREQKQVRFYLAQRCYECPLYQHFKENGTNIG